MGQANPLEASTCCGFSEDVKRKPLLFSYLQLVHITIVSFDLFELHAILWIGSRLGSVYGELTCNQVSKAEL